MTDGMQIVGDTAKLVFQDMTAEVVQFLKEKGWHDDGRSVGDEMALLHSEVSEALEEFRHGRMETKYEYSVRGQVVVNSKPTDVDGNLGKPVGFPSEMADILIRLLDDCERHGIDLVEEFRRKMAYNHTRAHRHGGKAI